MDLEMVAKIRRCAEVVLATNDDYWYTGRVNRTTAREVIAWCDLHMQEAVARAEEEFRSSVAQDAMDTEDANDTAKGTRTAHPDRTP